MPDATSAGSEPAPQVSVEDYIPASKTFVTQALIGINVLVFLAMLFFHVSFFEPTSQQVLPWGANLAPLTTSGQWWRLVTACFVHFGIIHIAMNMFILYQVGIFTETLFGNARYLFLYLFAGVAGNIAGLAIHPLTVSAGASGAIFGVYGGLLAFLVVRRGVVPKENALAVSKSAGIFIVYNLIYSLSSPSTDLTAHAFGLFGGFFAGCPLAWSLAPGPKAMRAVRGIAAAAVLTVIAYGASTHVQKSTPSQTEWFRALMSAPKVTPGKDGELYYTGTATRAEAQAVAQALVAVGYFKRSGVQMVFHKDANGASVSVPFDGDETLPPMMDQATSTVVDGKTVVTHQSVARPPLPWNDPDFLADTASEGPSIATAAGTLPFTMRLLNTNEDLRKEVRIDTFQTMVGKDHVEYTPAFTPQSAQAIGAALKDSRFFRDNGARAVLTKNNGVPEVSLFVFKGNIEQSDSMAYYTDRLGPSSPPSSADLP